jgi:hypothetical protein
MSGDREDETPFDDLPEAAGEDPFESLTRPETEGDADDPFDRLVDEDLGERTPAGDDPFERLDTEVDADVSWETLVSTDEPADGVTDDVDPTTDEDTVVPKRKYCQDCVYFTAPPELACTHDHGEIVEVVDLDSFRVRNCPVVVHRREQSFYDDYGIEDDD